MEIKEIYIAGHMQDGKFYEEFSYMPFSNKWEAHLWIENRKDNPDGWVPAMKIDYVIINKPATQYLT